jgi:Mn-dependent DtxR family transcriptional regulator
MTDTELLEKAIVAIAAASKRAERGIIRRKDVAVLLGIEWPECKRVLSRLTQARQIRYILFGCLAITEIGLQAAEAIERKGRPTYSAPQGTRF